MNLLFAIFIQAPIVPLPQQPITPNYIIERYAEAGKEVETPEYFEEENKNLYF